MCIVKFSDLSKECKNADMLMFGQHATCCISYLSEELFDKKKYSFPPPHRHERKKWTNFFLYLKRLLAVWARLMKCEPFWEYELKKVRYTSVWHDDQNNLNSLKLVFTPIPCLPAAQSTITELRYLLHQEDTVSSGMETGHLRSKTSDLLNLK